MKPLARSVFKTCGVRLINCCLLCSSDCIYRDPDDCEAGNSDRRSCSRQRLQRLLWEVRASTVIV